MILKKNLALKRSFGKVAALKDKEASC